MPSEPVSSALQLDLHAIAQSVATALAAELLSQRPAYGHQVQFGLYADGSNLIDPYWRCACLDWLNQQGYDVLTARHTVHSVMSYDKIPGGHMIAVQCPAALAPAALVHEVVKARG